MHATTLLPPLRTPISQRLRECPFSPILARSATVLTTGEVHTAVRSWLRVPHGEEGTQPCQSDPDTPRPQWTPHASPARRMTPLSQARRPSNPPLTSTSVRAYHPDSGCCEAALCMRCRRVIFGRAPSARWVYPFPASPSQNDAPYHHVVSRLPPPYRMRSCGCIAATPPDSTLRRNAAMLAEPPFVILR